MRITKFHFQVLRTQDVKGDVRSLEGDGTLLRPLLKITSGKNLLSDCLGVDYSIILLLLLLLLFTVGIYVCHIIIYAYYLPVCRHSCLGSAILIKVHLLLPVVFPSVGHKELLGPWFVLPRGHFPRICTFQEQFLVLLHSNVEQ